MNKTVAYKTVEAFADITQRKLWLKEGKHAFTDGNHLEVPLDHPNAMRHVEKLLAHILFKTDQAALYQFCGLYSAKIASICAQSGAKLSDSQLSGLRELLVQLGNVLEVRRVTSLWGLLYEGSRDEIVYLKKKLVHEYQPQAHHSIGILAVLREAGIPVPAGPLSEFVPVLDEAMTAVEFRGPTATLAILKRLIIQLVSKILGDNPNETRAAAIPQLINSAMPLPGDLESYYTQVKQNKHANSFTLDQAKKEAIEALNAPVDSEDFQKLLDSTTEKMMAEVEKAKNTQTHGESSKEQWISKDAKAKVIFHDIKLKDVEAHLEKAKLSPVELLPEDLAVVRKLRSLFQRIRSDRKRSVFSSGIYIDPMAYIQAELSGQSRPVFRETTPGRGFDALILMDRSSSMGGARKEQVERAGRILARAMDYSFVNLHVWGFQSHQVGQIDMYRFEPDLPRYETAKASVGGFTPIHLATHLAVRFLNESRNTRRLFMITDGVPNYHAQDGSVNRELLTKITSKEIRLARSKGVGVTGAIIPKIKKTPNGPVQDHSGKPFLNKMFGTRGDWRYLENDDIGGGLIRLVVQSFAEYLQSK